MPINAEVFAYIQDVFHMKQKTKRNALPRTAERNRGAKSEQIRRKQIEKARLCAK